MRIRDQVIVRAYLDTGAIDRACASCGADPNQWCQTPDGRDRRVPCVDRATAKPTAVAAICTTNREDNQ